VARYRNLNARQLKEYIVSKYEGQLSLSAAQSWLRNSAYFLEVSSDTLTRKSIRRAHHPELEQVLHESMIDYETTKGVITDATVKQHARAAVVTSADR